ncbi:unnamed protein product [Rotaria sp. Silwood2]|nr:unnamed protein product [Rotaria sp. Silwood2]
MAQQNKKKTSTKLSSNRRNRTDRIITFEQLSPEIIYEIFDYLTGNEIYISFFGLNKHINELVRHTPSLHLDLSQTTTKFYRSFQKIFCEKNIVSVIVGSDDIYLLKRLSSSTDRRRLKSISMLDLSLHIFQTRIPETLNNFKNELVSLKIQLMNIRSHGTAAETAQSFQYILTQLPLLKYLTLDGYNDINEITYLDSSIINNTVVRLTISIIDRVRWVSLLHRFAKLIVFTVDFRFENQRKRVAPRDSNSYFVSQIHEQLSIDQPFRLRHVKIYQYNMILENFEELFRLMISPTLLTLSFFNCLRPFTRFPLPKRQPPFLDGTQWHDLMKKYLLPTMKRFYIEYEDVDNTMSMTNLVQVTKQFMKYSGPNLLWEVKCSYDQKTKFLSFDFIFV